MPALETVPGESKTKPNHIFLAFLFLVFVLSSLLLIYLLKNPGRGFGPFLSKVTLDEMGRNRIKISAQELDEAYRLEKFLNPFFANATPSALVATDGAAQQRLSKSRSLQTGLVEGLAKERIFRRKILEAEAKALKVDLNEVNNSAGQIFPLTDDARRIENKELLKLFRYDKSLLNVFRKRVEGVKQVGVLSVVPQASPSGQINHSLLEATAKKILVSLKSNNSLALSEILKLDLPKNLFVQESIFDGSSLTLSLPVGLKENNPQLQETPFGFDIYRIKKQINGLGMSFEEWYQNVRKKYL